MSKHKHDIRCAGHLETMLIPEQAKFTVRNVIKMIKAGKLEFDAIACRGVSGLLIAPIVAMRLNKTLLVVRKENEDTHSKRAVEGDVGAKKYLIIDDFIDSGDTVRAITSAIYNVRKNMRCVGFIAYKRLSVKPTPYSSAPTLEHQMERAWWDQESNPIRRYFPEGYIKAVNLEEEACEKTFTLLVE